MNDSLFRHVIREILRESFSKSINEIGMTDSTFDRAARGARDLTRSGIILTNDQALNILQTSLDIAGLVPGIGEAADLVNASIYASKKQYGLAALSVLCIIPAIGTAFGAAKLSGKGIPAELIYEHASDIEKMVNQISPVIPDGEKVAEAVRKIVSDIKIGAADSVDITTGVATRGTAKGVTKTTASTAAKWYANPKWKEWAASIVAPNLTKVLNEATSTRARNRLAKVLTRGNVDSIQRLRAVMRGPFGHLMDDSMIVEMLRQNTTISKFVSDNFKLILEDLKQNLRYRIIVDPDDISKFTSNLKTLAHADPASKEVVIFLPRFENFVKEPAVLTEQLINAVKHETWHIIDSRLAAIFKQKMQGEFLSELDEMAKAMKKMTDNFNLSNIGEDLKDYIKDPRELFVRVKEMRDFLKKTDFSPEDLKSFANSDISKVPNDITFFHNMMQGISDDAYKNLADAMNEIL